MMDIQIYYGPVQNFEKPSYFKQTNCFHVAFEDNKEITVSYKNIVSAFFDSEKAAIHHMHIKRWRRLRDGAPAPWQADTNAYKQRFWCHDRPRSEKNGGFGYARGIFHQETMSVYR